MTAEQVSQRGSGASVRHVNHIYSGYHLEQLAAHMGDVSDAGRRHIELARIGLGIGNKLGNCLGLNGRIDHNDQWLADNAGDGRHIADKIESELVVKRGIERGRAVHDKEHMAVRRCSDDRLGGDVAVRAGPVLDYKWPA